MVGVARGIKPSPRPPKPRSFVGRAAVAHALPSEAPPPSFSVVGAGVSGGGSGMEEAGMRVGGGMGMAGMSVGGGGMPKRGVSAPSRPHGNLCKCVCVYAACSLCPLSECVCECVRRSGSDDRLALPAL